MTANRWKNRVAAIAAAGLVLGSTGSLADPNPAMLSHPATSALSCQVIKTATWGKLEVHYTGNYTITGGVNGPKYNFWYFWQGQKKVITTPLKMDMKPGATEVLLGDLVPPSDLGNVCGVGAGP